MCIITKTVRPVDELIRFVLAPDCVVVPDVKCELPGRGVWVTADAKLIAAAVSKNAFSRGFKAAARASSDLVELVGTILARRALSLLGLSQKAGLVRTGFVKVQQLLEKQVVAALVHANDASADGARKLAPLKSEDVIIEKVTAFTGEQLSLALGRANVVHAAVTKGRLAKEFVLAARKYENYWSGELSAQTVR